MNDTLTSDDSRLTSIEEKLMELKLKREKKVLSEDVRETIRTLRKRGEYVIDIAKVFNVSRQTVHRVLNKPVLSKMNEEGFVPPLLPAEMVSKHDEEQKRMEMECEKWKQEIEKRHEADRKELIREMEELREKYGKNIDHSDVDNVFNLDCQKPVKREVKQKHEIDAQRTEELTEIVKNNGKVRDNYKTLLDQDIWKNFPLNRSELGIFNEKIKPFDKNVQEKVFKEVKMRKLGFCFVVILKTFVKTPERNNWSICLKEAISCYRTHYEKRQQMENNYNF